MITVGGQQIISSVIQLCGGENVFAALASMAPTVSVEAVIAADPEAIVASGMDVAAQTRYASHPLRARSSAG